MTNQSKAAETKTKQIYAHLRDRIFRGDLAVGERLPSTRDLANEWGASRTVMVDVYEQLIAEGYLEGRAGSGTYVTDWGSGGHSEWNAVPPFSPGHAYAREASFEGINFEPSYPSLHDVPRKKWLSVYRECFEDTVDLDFGYGDPAGNLRLRTQISQSLLLKKGIRCTPSQVIVTAGATQALSLLAKLLLAPGRELVIEDPTAMFIHDIFASSGATLIPVPVDKQGLLVHEIPGDIRPKAVFVTPSHQFPFGGILPIQRRMQLLEYARRTGCYVIEDDYDSEFRYAGLPVRAMRELDAERVIYVGTFSKNLFPALRLGYMVVPELLMEPLVRIKQTADFHSPALPQITLARFMEDRHLERHVSRMKRIYGRRRFRMISSFQRYFGSQVSTEGDAAGLHLVAAFQQIRFDSDMTKALEERRIRVYPAETFAIRKGRYENKLIMGFGNVTENQIEEGIRTMAEVLSHKK